MHPQMTMMELRKERETLTQLRRDLDHDIASHVLDVAALNKERQRWREERTNLEQEINEARRVCRLETEQTKTQLAKDLASVRKEREQLKQKSIALDKERESMKKQMDYTYKERQRLEQLEHQLNHARNEFNAYERATRSQFAELKITLANFMSTL